MIKKYEVKTLKVNYDLKGLRAGDTVRIKCDKDGTPIDAYWRRRMKDSAIDNCVEIVVSSRPKKTKAAEVKNAAEATTKED